MQEKRKIEEKTPAPRGSQFVEKVYVQTVEKQMGVMYFSADLRGFFGEFFQLSAEDLLGVG